MTNLAKHIIVAGAENRPLMLEKSMYDSWTSRIRLFIKGKKHGKMILDSIDNGPLVYSIVEENEQTRPKKYSKLTKAQQLQDDCDVQATNIILHGLPPDVYELVNHQEVAKDIWDRVKRLMKGTKLSYQECECRLSNLFDKFAYVQGETLYEYYWRFSQLINDMHTIGMTMQQVQVNTKFLNALLLELSKFITDVKLAKSLYTTTYDQFLAVPTFQQGEDPIECINKAMAFLFAMASRFPPLNNQLRMSSNPRNQATIQDGRVITEDLDAYESDCDDLSPAKAVLMANLSSYDPNVLSEESQDAVIQDTNSSAPNDLLELFLVEQITDYIAHLDKENQTNKMLLVIKIRSILKKAQRIQPTLYDGSVIVKEHAVSSVTDDEEILILEEESRSKMLDKQNDPISIEKKIKISPIDHSNSVTKKRNGHKESLKDRIKSLSRKDSLEKVKIDIDEIETINIELDHILLNFRYNAQLQEKVFANAALKKELRKLKGKNVVDTTVSKPNAIIASGMFKLDIEPISQRLQFNRDAHEIYIDKTIENTDTLCRF
ncbi:hypothetical protein Tco_0415384 [Tanacetum coccineum]